MCLTMRTSASDTFIYASTTSKDDVVNETKTPVFHIFYLFTASQISKFY